MAASPSHRFEVHPDRDRVFIAAKGELDVASAPGLRAELQDLRASGWTRIVADLSGVTFMDTTAVHVLLEAADSAASEGWELRMVDGSPAVRRILGLTGVADRIERL
ncbi:STAS domain-containing protein [Baekduia soli]|uniref:STAS domain-containing protein n=1 Tax=Baekduia soli TaxID=496014 RepID=UPI0016525CDD|nr:STAS domain-containing protein [Baekduia soli]